MSQICAYLEYLFHKEQPLIFASQNRITTKKAFTYYLGYTYKQFIDILMLKSD